MRTEFRTDRVFSSRAAAQAELDEWVNDYHHRPYPDYRLPMGAGGMGAKSCRTWCALLVVFGLDAWFVGILDAPAVTAAETAVTVAYRVNAGGPMIPGTPSWTADLKGSPSPYVNGAAMGDTTFSAGTAVNVTDPSIPAGTPAQVFADERWDRASAPEMQWNFPAPAGKRYEVRLYFAETYSGTKSVGARVFDVAIDGMVVLDNYDIFAKVGGSKGVVERFTVTSDSNIDIDFAHVVQNPAVTAIEVVELAAASQLSATPSSVGFGSVAVNSVTNQIVQLANQGAATDPSITVTGTTITGTDASLFTDSFDDTAGAVLAGGATSQITVTFRPTGTGAKSASLKIAHSGTNSPLTVPLSGTGTSTAAIAFSKSALIGESSTQPTSLQFGPDGRLYVAQQDGLIKIYGVNRTGKNAYAVTSTQTITSIRSIPNHNDDGALNTSVTTRQVTGLLVVGTAANPVIYLASSDPRIGAGPSGTDTGLDTNSGVLSKLTWDGSTWQKKDLVRGLPRSEENHSPNGLQLDPASNTLFLTQGGNTNQGAPSNSFARLPEVALSAAILSINLGMIGNTTYNLPTLDDSGRAGTADAGDPLGGNNGKNQAKLVPGGPVQIHTPGFRNPYDIVLTRSGRMYTVDNGGNAGWGDVPVNEGPQGACTNAINEPGTSTVDTFHLVKLSGYGGHPNPTRGNMANKFSTPAQSPVSVANPVECDWRAPGPERGNITSYPESTNGITEYTASNFGGQMNGDLLTASFDNRIYRAKLNSNGTQLLQGQALFQTVGNTPLDVTTQADAAVFPGTIWVADIGDGKIYAFEPADYGGAGGTTCAGTDSTTLDEDGDGYSNADEIDNGTNPCSSADVPPDRDADKVSDINDSNDDNDALPDTSDPFAIDPNNGTTTATPLQLKWDNDSPFAGGLLTLGFTGLMTNGITDYQKLFDPSKMTAGGAAGVATVDQVPPGDAYTSTNTQQYGFQVGVMPKSDVITAHTRILGPFAGLTPQGAQSMGLFIGSGNQDNYAKLVVSANNGAGGIEFLKEVGGVATKRPMASVTLPGPDAIDLYLAIDRVASTVQPSFSTTKGTTISARTKLGGPEPIPPAWHTGAAAMAAGIISTSSGGSLFPATWDFIEVVPEAVTQPALVASPSSATMTATVGGTSQTTAISLTSSDSSTAAFSVTDDAPWLTASPTSGSTPMTLTLTADMAGLAPGTYQAVVTVAATGFTSVVVPITVTLNPSATAYGLVFSTTNTRTSPQPLTGTTVSGNIFAFTTPDTGVARVRFFVDNTAGTGTPYRTESTAPYDLGGGAVATANPYNTAQLSNGPHTITAAVDLASGGTQMITASVTVANVGWSTAQPMPIALGEVAGGIIAGKAYLVGEGSPSTLAFDLTAKTWASTGIATRPFPGNHHGAEVVGTKLYLFGGLGSGAEGRVQIYDPATNAWTAGAAMPFAAGASSTAKVGNFVYVVGGIVAGTTTAQAARYDPAANTWSSIAPMPQGRNHAAAETDGTKMYVFGGRGVGSGNGNTVANGFDTVQIYDPATNTWVSSLDSASTLSPLPQARGGMGTSVYLNGEFYVIGGETATGAGATASGVYSRVDIYNPITNAWRAGSPMPTARHGIFPVLNGNQIHVAGGGTRAGFSSSTVHEILQAG